MAAGWYHEPVMVAEVVRYLEPSRGGVILDGTVGGGGHSAAILEASPSVRVLGVDRDAEALEAARVRLVEYGARFEARLANFADVAEALGQELSGALLDLGVSSRQIDTSARGFSFRAGTPLDMRMGQDEAGPTAADVLNEASAEELANIFYRYGEERRSRRLAAEIVERRATVPFRVSEDLVAVLERVLGARLTMQDRARLFQALRIAVNEELAVLERALPVLRDRLVAEGVLVVIAYHSLEDRLVKDAFREWSRACVCPPELPVCRCRGRALGTTLTRKPLLPTAAEVERNPRSRSARLRAWRRAA